MAASIRRLACAAYRCTPPRNLLIAWPQRKIARFPYENYAVSIRSFRMDTSQQYLPCVFSRMPGLTLAGHFFGLACPCGLASRRRLQRIAQRGPAGCGLQGRIRKTGLLFVEHWLPCLEGTRSLRVCRCPMFSRDPFMKSFGRFYIHALCDASTRRSLLLEQVSKWITLKTI